MSPLVQTAVDAWARWDNAPKLSVTAVARVEAVSALAASLGVSAVDLARRVQEARRAGLAPVEAIPSAVRSLS